MVVPQGYDQKAFKQIGHLLAVDHAYPYWVLFITGGGSLLPVICEIIFLE
ncbi:hypothetical protein ACW0KB_15980 [Virgibacillus salarius]|nr:hypothetical protein [uncultured Virgibacillus sp.]